MNVELADKSLMVWALDEFERGHSWDFSIRLQDLGLNYYQSTSEISAFQTLINDAKQALTGLAAEGGEIDDRFGPVIRQAIIAKRLSTAQSIESRSLR